MDRGAPDNSLAERILTADRPVVVVRGPAACGKTAAALAVYARYLDEAGRPSCWLLAPNAPAARQLRRKLLDASPAGVAASPTAITFAALADRILAAADEPARPMPPFERRLLLRRVLGDLLEAGELVALGAVADTPGVIPALDRAIAELKRAAVEPDDLARAVGPRTDKRADLVAVYRRYQQALHEAGAYDVEGQSWLAREHLRRCVADDAPAPGLAGVAAVVADGFTDFTPTQLGILALLAGRLERVVVTLPYAEDGRERMWHWTRRTLASLRRQFGERMGEIEAAPKPVVDEAVPLRGPWDALFDPDAKCARPPELTVLAAAGIDAEVAAVARRVKGLLVGGAAAGGIAVLARSLEAYREPVERIFAAHDIGVAPVAEALPDVPVIRFLLDLAALAPEFAWRDVLRVIKSSYFRPGAMGEFDATAVRAAEVLIREGNVLAGRGAYDKAAEAAARRAIDREQDDGAPTPMPRRPTRRAFRDAAEMLAALFDLAEGAADAAGLLRLADSLRLRSAAREHGEPELIARDLRALSALEGALRRLPDPLPSVAEVREALAAVPCPAARAESLVDVLDVIDARAIRYEHVFLLGLSERQFPPRFVEGSLIGEADRAEWADHGVRLDSRSDLTAREMLLFYLAASRADRGLTVSYLASDASGKVGSPSSFLLWLLEPMGGIERIGVRRIPPGMLIPPPEELAGPRDALNAAVAGLFHEAAEPNHAALARVRRDAAGPLRRAAMGIWARHRRWLEGPCNEFDGRITDPALLGGLEGRYPARTVFSAGRLNTYGQCPWQYFATYVLRLAPLAEPQRRLEPQTRGLLCHRVLQRLMGRLARRSGLPLRLPDVGEAELAAALDKVVDQIAEEEGRWAAYPALWQIQVRQIRRDVWEYLLTVRQTDAMKAESLHFELAFGPGMAEDADAPDAAGAEPVTVPTSAGEVRLRGRIDRVDRIRFEGVEGLLIVDYKTGRLPRLPDVLAGRDLQLPLYAAAAEQLLDGPCLGGAYHKIGKATGRFDQFFAAVGAARGGGYKLDGAYEDNRRAAIDTVGRFVEQMRAGRFDACPTHDCPSYCPFRRICHYSPARAERKIPPAVGSEPASCRPTSS